MPDTSTLPGDKAAPLTQEQYLGIERLLQWPEDLPAWDRLHSPTRVTAVELFGGPDHA